MIYDIKKYEMSRKSVIDLATEMTPEKAEKDLGRIAVATGVPIVVVGHMIGEYFGYSDILDARISRLEKFYDVKGILGKRNDSIMSEIHPHFGGTGTYKCGE